MVSCPALGWSMLYYKSKPTSDHIGLFLAQELMALSESEDERYIAISGAEQSLSIEKHLNKT